MAFLVVKPNVKGSGTSVLHSSMACFMVFMSALCLIKLGRILIDTLKLPKLPDTFSIVLPVNKVILENVFIS